MLKRLPCVPLICASAMVVSTVAHAHPVTVDGSAAEWFTRSPSVDNLGLIARDASQAGEYIWRDATADTRTDISTPEVVGDIVGVQVTGSPGAMGILVRRQSGTVFTGAPIQLQIAIDMDRVAGSGESYLAGFADTQVDNAARWERLVQTMFGSGGTAVVLDTSFTQVASVPAVQAADVIEISVPWTALGLNAPPTTPLRLTIASFRAQPNDITIDIGGPNISNAVDVVTDYGNPVASAYPNTWIEVQDNTVSYWADIHFAANGEVYSPLLVTRFVSNASAANGGEWVVLRNMSPNALALDKLKVGDEETPDGPESMYTFPAGSSLAAGASFVVAENATNFFTRFGVNPDAEFSSSTALVPDMSKFAPWANGNWALANTGDEVLALDGSNTILDVVSFASGTYPGVTQITTAPGADQAESRKAGYPDTDNCQNDFQNLGATCKVDADCPSKCYSCVLFACEMKPAGTSCADANVCNGAEACDAAGACVGGAPLVCADSNPCTADSCDPVAGCAHSPEPVGTPCADADLCNGTESCNSAGVCSPGTPLNCADTNPCTADSCVPATGCAHAFVPAGTSCADSTVCNGAESCDVGGTCQPGTPPNCADTNPCTLDSCDAVSGCVHAPASQGTACADNNVCNGLEACDNGGTCQAGTPLTCDDNNACTADSCDTVTGCAHANVSSGTSCSDGDPCNGDETCDGNGTCVAGTPLPGTCVDAGQDADGGQEDADASEQDADASEQDAAVEAGPDANPDGQADVLIEAAADAVVDAKPDTAADASTDAKESGADAVADSKPATDGPAAGDAHADTGSGGSSSTPPAESTDDGGCGCRAVASDSTSSGAALVGLAALGLILVRRRRRDS